MDKQENKSILFYSTHPNDLISRQFLEELNKNKLLNDQFIKICVTDPKITIPKKILEANSIPVVASPGFPDLIKGENALSWIRNNSFNGKGNGFNYGDVSHSSKKDFSTNFTTLVEDEFQKTDYNQHYNDEYNLGFKIEDQNNVSAGFSKVKDNTHIVTYRDQSMSQEQDTKVNTELQNIINKRNMDVPRPIQRVGGYEPTMPQQRPPRSQREQHNNQANRNNFPVVPNRMNMPPRPQFQ
jgi:hypothetical protein